MKSTGFILVLSTIAYASSALSEVAVDANCAVDFASAYNLESGLSSDVKTTEERNFVTQSEKLAQIEHAKAIGPVTSVDTYFYQTEMHGFVNQVYVCHKNECATYFFKLAEGTSRLIAALQDLRSAKNKAIFYCR